MGRLRHIEQVAINIVLHNEASRVKPGISSAAYPGGTHQTSPPQNLPVVKDLTTHNMAPDAPAVGIPFLAQPVVAQDLGVKVVCFKRGVVNMHFRALEKEEAVMVDQDVAPIEPEEDRDVDVVVVVNELRSSRSV